MWEGENWALPNSFEVARDFPSILFWQTELKSTQLNLCFRHKSAKDEETSDDGTANEVIKRKIKAGGSKNDTSREDNQHDYEEENNEHQSVAPPKRKRIAKDANAECMRDDGLQKNEVNYSPQ